MTSIEYREVSDEDYKQYENNANKLLLTIGNYFNKEISLLKYADIISYFESNYNIMFTFFDQDPVELFGDSSWENSVPSDSWIKYNDVVKKQNFCFLDSIIVERTSGITIPKDQRTLIMINQNCNIQRLIFTILHELSHFYFHILDEQKKKIFISLAGEPLEGKYPPELLPFEDEANIIASILFCSNDRLEHMLKTKYSFKDMCRQNKMSASAMHNRLLNYFEHTLNMPHRLSLGYVWGLRRNDKKYVYGIQTYIKQQQQIQQKVIESNIEAEYTKKLSKSSFWSDILSDMKLTDSSNKTK